MWLDPASKLAGSSRLSRARLKMIFLVFSRRPLIAISSSDAIDL